MQCVQPRAIAVFAQLYPVFGVCCRARPRDMLPAAQGQKLSFIVEVAARNPDEAMRSRATCDSPRDIYELGALLFGRGHRLAERRYGNVCCR